MAVRLWLIQPILNSLTFMFVPMTHFDMIMSSTPTFDIPNRHYIFVKT